MHRFFADRFGRFAPHLAGLLVGGAALAQTPPLPAPKPAAPVIQQVQLPIPEAGTAQQPAPPTAAPAAPAPAPAPAAPAGPGGAPPGINAAPREPVNTVGPTSSVPVGSQASPVLNAPDLGELLSKSVGASGVEVQRRNAISSDPRVRGYHTGQVVTLGDGALFFPARQDLDTAVAKFDPGTVRDIVIRKGPYSAQYGPGFAFLDIVTIDAPRYPKGFEVHGRTAAGYSTNGLRWDALQSVFLGDRDWGFRATYNILNGSDYRAGDGTDIAGSYRSQNINFAAGVDLTKDSKIEFKGLRVFQNDVEFPGLYFDIQDLTTEAYSLRYTMERQEYFDRLILDTWYNTTVSNGDTREFAKQAFVQQLLLVSFNPNLPPGTRVATAPPGSLIFDDFSTTHFSNKSLGYRLGLGWGDVDKANLTVGSDFTLIGQTLVENIRLQQLAGAPLNRPGQPFPPDVVPPPPFTQNQGLPKSSAIDPGLFLEAALPVTQRLKMRMGGRYDYVHTTSDPRQITGNINLFGTPETPDLNIDVFNLDPIVYSTDPTRTNLDRDFNLFAGFVSGEYKLDEHLTALGSFGYAERAPTLTELYAAGPFVGVLQQGTSRVIGDPSLRKERLSQFDVGVQADYTWFRGGVNGFYAFVNDYITFDLNKGGFGITQVVFSNTDRATLAGGEMFFQTDLTSWLTPFGSAAYVQGIDRTHRDTRRPPALASSRRDNLITNERAAASEPLPQIPPLEIRAGFRVHQPRLTPKWQVEFSARSVMGQNNIATSLQEQPTSGFTVFDVRTYWQVMEKWLVSAGVENFGDKLYREHLDPISGNVLGVGPLFRPGTNFYFASQVTY